MLKRNIFLVSIILILGCCLHFEYFKSISLNSVNNKLIDSYYAKEESNNREASYLGILEVPSINLKRGFFSLDSSLNQVDKNIELISSCNPDNPCDFILASHSGNSAISYFKHLDHLKLQDKAILDYEHHFYIYHLTSILNQKKNGMISLEKKTISRLVLTTCDKYNQDIQKVYIFEKEEA